MNTKFWMVVWNKKSGDFKNATIEGTQEENTELISEKFEKDYPEYRVIHVGEGAQPPKTYRSLQYVN
jgi:hypothetical protein